MKISTSHKLKLDRETLAILPTNQAEAVLGAGWSRQDGGVCQTMTGTKDESNG